MEEIIFPIVLVLILTRVAVKLLEMVFDYDYVPIIATTKSNDYSI
jgi:hypothetical protein